MLLRCHGWQVKAELMPLNYPNTAAVAPAVLCFVWRAHCQKRVIHGGMDAYKKMLQRQSRDEDLILSGKNQEGCGCSAR